jgi:hypothetical protein
MNMGMKLYQPVLFVGLGGTGCDVGAELERLLREEICGPDGNDFRTKHNRPGMLPYQLPGCVQFVYADVNQTELDRLPQRVVPSLEDAPAAKLTAGYVTGLVPEADSYPDLAVRLHLELDSVVKPWLPEATPDEPKVSPLHKGAGQFPTVGRAALFGTFKDDGIRPAVQAIRDAVGRLAGSGADLTALNDGKPMQIRGVDVFVAFSVAGGTGAGIFYDYLHLIAETLKQSSIPRVKIYPLVLMPSAFPEGLGGGRAAELNAGRALLDLFRLVDQQNGSIARTELRASHDQVRGDQEEVAVVYPDHTRIVIKTGTVQTGFLFSRPEGATRSDMHRSIASLVTSLVGTEMADGDNTSGEHHQSFADSFINKAVQRQLPAENGIGNRGVSTALVASLSVPIDELAEIVGARLLRTAIEQISAPNPRVETIRADGEDFLTRAGVSNLLRRPGVPFAEPPAAHGARDVAAALHDRRESMLVGIGSLRAQLDRDVPALVTGFHPTGAARQLLSRMDIFRLERVVFGHQSLTGEAEQGGAAGLLHRRRAAPAAAQGYGPVPPVPPELKDRFLKKVEWNDEPVVVARNVQNTWYEWQTHVAWANAWDPHTQRWSRPLDELQRHVSALTRALSDFARADAQDFNRRSGELYRERVGVSYLLPAGAGRMEQFYHQVIHRMTDRMARDGIISVNSTEADLLKALVGADTWPKAYEESVDHSPEHAISYLRDRVKTEVKTFLRAVSPGQQPILPRLHDLLLQAAGHRSQDGPGLQQEYRDELGGKLAGMLPANYTPQGTGPLSVLISYPADAQQNRVVEEYLRTTVNLPIGPRITAEYRRTDTEVVSVVLFRTGMGVTEVDEVKNLLWWWSSALDRPEPTDLLRWRQRTGYDFSYLATREGHRVSILHRLLCALWNGRASIQGPDTSPDRINFTLGGVTMTLPLRPLGRASSWGSLLRSYERWALDDDDLHRRFCGQLMRELPEGLDERPPLPHELYLVLRDLAEGQVEILDDMIKKRGDNHQSRADQMRGFWVSTLPAALDHRFTGKDAPVAWTLRDLEAEADAGAHG